jgi:DHA3 family macrolide efflux protein-like MFS transporter
MQWILAMDVITAALAILPLFFFAIPQPDMKVSNDLAGESPSYWDDLKAGVKYVYSWKGLLVILGMATLLNMVLTPAFSFLPLLISKHFGLGAMELGLLDSTFGIGIIVGGALLGIWGGFKRKIYTTMVGLMGIGIGTLGLGLIGEDGFYIALVFAVIMGVSQPITNGSLMGVMQAKVSPDMQGRVFSLTGSVSSGLAPLGLIIAGPLSETYGIQVWFVVGGVICLLMSISGFIVPAVRNFEDYEAPSSGEMLEVTAE